MNILSVQKHLIVIDLIIGHGIVAAKQLFTLHVKMVIWLLQKHSSTQNKLALER